MIFALSTHSIDTAIFHVASALQVPVLILALAALALVIFELGSFAVEVRSRRGRRFSALSGAADQARDALLRGDRSAAVAATSGVARSSAMGATLAFILSTPAPPAASIRSTRPWPTSTSTPSGDSAARACWCGPAPPWA